VILGGQIPQVANAQNILFRKPQGTRTSARYCPDGNTKMEIRKIGYVCGAASTESEQSPGGGILCTRS
jgi:hypothetical protein